MGREDLSNGSRTARYELGFHQVYKSSGMLNEEESRREPWGHFHSQLDILWDIGRHTVLFRRDSNDGKVEWQRLNLALQRR